jgi:two-component system chemotaxis sensor kinase CheA
VDLDRVLKKAVELGMVTAGQAAGMDEQGKVNLIFMPRLTTKDEVSTLSGRGVGMDAVKSAIDGLGGSVEVKSTRGGGTEFSLFVPFHVQNLSNQRVAA